LQLLLAKKTLNAEKLGSGASSGHLNRKDQRNGDNAGEAAEECFIRICKEGQEAGK